MSVNIGETLLNSLNTGLISLANFVPKFIAGLIILLLGVIIASVIKQLVMEILKALHIEAFLKRYGVPEARDKFTWSNILAELIKWFVIIIFLIPTADVWGLPQVTVVLSTFMLYLPNVLVAAIIAVVGFVFARLAHDIVLGSTQGITPDTSRAIASITRWAVIIFVLLAVLNQLGVASDLIRILFTGIVAMIAVGGGIAFGLGGQNLARDILDGIRKKLS